MGYVIPAIVFDGRKELPRLFPDKKLQPCQFLLQKNVRKYLTKHLKTEVDIELKEIMDTLTKNRQEILYRNAWKMVPEMGRLPQR